MKLSDFGQVVAPDLQAPKALVVFYPPATGDKGQQREEAGQLQDSGYVSLLAKNAWSAQT